MTFTLVARTATLALAGAGAAVIGMADVLDQAGRTTAGLLAAAYLGLAALLLLRLRQIALTVDDDAVVVRGILTTVRVGRDEVAAVRADGWRSEVVLRDGGSIPMLLRSTDLEGLELRASEAPHPTAGLLAA